MANKTALNLHCQKHKLDTATYQTEKTDSGLYNGLVNCQGQLFKSQESHSSKKSAENDAASVALDHLTKSFEKLANNMPVEDSKLHQRFDNGSSSRQSFLPPHPIEAKFGIGIRAVSKPCSAVRVPASEEECERAWVKLKEYALSHNLKQPQHNLHFEHNRMVSGMLTVGSVDFKLDPDEINLAFEQAKYQLTLKALKHFSIEDVSVKSRHSPSNVDSTVHAHQHQQHLTSLSPPPELTSRSILVSSASNSSSHHQQSDLVLSHASRLPVSQPSVVASSQPAVLPTNHAKNSETIDLNSKQLLNEFCQKSKLPLPEYTTLSPIDCVGYVSLVKVNGKTFQSTVEPNKKRAEQLAAKSALEDFGQLQKNAEVVQSNTQHAYQRSLSSSSSKPTPSVLQRSTSQQQSPSGMCLCFLLLCADL